MIGVYPLGSSCRNATTVLVLFQKKEILLKNITQT